MWLTGEAADKAPLLGETPVESPGRPRSGQVEVGDEGDEGLRLQEFDPSAKQAKGCRSIEHISVSSELILNT